MPIGMKDAPQTLPKPAQTLWVDTFNGVFENCKGPKKECDQRSARIAWDQIKGKYRKVKDKWIAKSEYSEAYHDILLNITKASLQPDGSVRWQAVASDTGKDKADERTSLDLFQDWIDRVTYKADIPYLPAPKMPFLGVSHYPALDGFGEGGITRRMFIDGNVFKADGVFRSDSAVGQRLLDEVKIELALIKKGEQQIEKPIRISAGWWDIEHYHGDSNFLFTRQALTDKCPLCEQGQTSDKIYKAGQLDHFAATRVPMNTRTSLELKSMAKKITRREDAESIIGPDLAEEMEKRARMVGKSDTEDGDELHPAMVTRAATKIGSFIKRKREEAEMSIVDLAAKTPVTDGTIGDIENGTIGTPSVPVIKAIAKALKVSEKELNDMLPGDAKPAEEEATKGDMLPGEFLGNIRRKKKKKYADVEEKMGLKAGRLKRIEDDEDEIDFETMADIAEALDMDDEEIEDMGQRFGKKRKADTEDDEDDDETEAPPKGSKKEELLARFGNKRRKTPPKQKSDYGDEMMIRQPLGGATSMRDAQDFIDTKEKFGKLRSHWDVFQIVVDNIMMSDDEAVPDKIKAMGQAVKDLGSQIDTLKAGLSDAFLIQESAAAYEDYEDEATEEYIEYLEDDNEVNIMTEEINSPEEVLQAARKAALENKSLSSADREAAVQEAFNTYAETVQSQLAEADPASQADQIATAIKGALAEVFTPLSEQMALITAKMAQGETPLHQPQGVTQLHEVYVPQQKSMMAPMTIPQPVQPQSGLPISKITGKPSKLRDMIEKSVGMHS
jgi:transcriptional regulator with XRE-family HTH domain